MFFVTCLNTSCLASTFLPHISSLFVISVNFCRLNFFSVFYAQIALRRISRDDSSTSKSKPHNDSLMAQVSLSN